MVLDGEVNSGGGEGAGALEQMLEIDHLMVDPGMLPLMDPVQAPEQIYALTAQSLLVASCSHQPFMDPHPAETAELLLLDVEPFRQREARTPQRLDQTRSRHGMADGQQAIDGLKLQHAAIAGRCQISMEGELSGLNRVCFQALNQALHLIHQVA